MTTLNKKQMHGAMAR